MKINHIFNWGFGVLGFKVPPYGRPGRDFKASNLCRIEIYEPESLKE